MKTVNTDHPPEVRAKGQTETPTQTIDSQRLLILLNTTHPSNCIQHIKATVSESLTTLQLCKKAVTMQGFLFLFSPWRHVGTSTQLPQANIGRMTNCITSIVLKYTNYEPM